MSSVPACPVCSRQWSSSYVLLHGDTNANKSKSFTTFHYMRTESDATDMICTHTTSIGSWLDYFLDGIRLVSLEFVPCILNIQLHKDWSPAGMGPEHTLTSENFRDLFFCNYNDEKTWICCCRKSDALRSQTAIISSIMSKNYISMNTIRQWKGRTVYLCQIQSNSQQQWAEDSFFKRKTYKT